MCRLVRHRKHSCHAEFMCLTSLPCMLFLFRTVSKVWPLTYERPYSLSEEGDCLSLGSNSITFPATRSESLVDCGVEFADGAECGVQTDTSNEEGEEQRGSFVGEDTISASEKSTPSRSGVQGGAPAQFAEEPLSVGCRHTLAGHEVRIFFFVQTRDSPLFLSCSCECAKQSLYLTCT